MLVKILMYHRIVADSRVLRPDRPLCVPISLFRTHMSLLDKWGFTSITFDDYRLALQGELTLPKKPVIITFDDGYQDTFDNAFPVLQQFGMRGVVFVLGDTTIHSSIWDDGIVEVLSPLMSSDQVLTMQAAGFEIGSHSMTHKRLTELPDAVAWEEISRSKVMLEVLLNAPVRTFSYPYGLVNETIKSMVHDAGYAHGCGVFTGPPVFNSDQFEVRRMPVFGNTDVIKFALRMLTRYEYYAWTRACCRKMYHSLLRRENHVHQQMIEV